MQGDKERLQAEIERLQTALDTAAEKAYQRGYNHGHADAMRQVRQINSYPTDGTSEG